MSVVCVYDEADLMARVEVVDRVGRAGFACACAELLMPLYVRCVGVPGDAVRLRGALDIVWEAVEGRGGGNVEQAVEMADASAPDDADGADLSAAYIENAVAAVAYAADTWLADDHRDAVWAARQLYEAADLRAQQDLLASADLNDRHVKRSLVVAPVVQWAVEAIASLLSLVEEGGEVGHWSEVRSTAHGTGQTWAESFFQ